MMVDDNGGHAGMMSTDDNNRVTTLQPVRIVYSTHQQSNALGQRPTTQVGLYGCTLKKGISSSWTSPHRYRKSHTIWDHTVLPATRQRWLSRLYPSWSWYSIEQPEGMQGWVDLGGGWWLHPQDSQQDKSEKITGSAVTGIRTNDRESQVWIR